MNRILFLLLLFLPFTLQAKYIFDETFYIPIEELGFWKRGKQASSENGASLTRYLLANETETGWSKLLNIQFKDRQLVKGNTAEEAMRFEQSLSPQAKSEIILSQPNDITYIRSFPTGESEVVRMVMTKKGLHRAAYIKKGPFEAKERALWSDRLMNGVIGR